MDDNDINEIRCPRCEGDASLIGTMRRENRLSRSVTVVLHCASCEQVSGLEIYTLHGRTQSRFVLPEDEWLQEAQRNVPLDAMVAGAAQSDDEQASEVWAPPRP